MKIAKIIFFCLMFLISASLVLTAGAQQDPCSEIKNKVEKANCEKLYAVGQESYGTESLKEGDPTTLATKVGLVINLVLSTFGVVFLGLVIFSGIQWMTAGGNEEKVTKARERIIRAAIGLGIILIAWAMTTYIVTTIQG